MIIQDSDNADFMSMDLGIITNTGMRTDSSSNILQVGFFLYSIPIHGSMKIMKKNNELVSQNEVK